MHYRPEVDGLRAIAVVSVILFHAGLPEIGGGFLGVDIFFVISGYLITGIIVHELAEGRFSIRRFYERRIRRIIPALVVVMALSSVAAWRLMLPDDLENFGQSLVATTLFANNILLLLTSGYFELEAEFKPLMHTWSLGVEEQYYILAPAILLSSFRLGGRRLIVAIVALLTVGSFAFCLWAAAAHPIANFLLLPSRAWELGFGSLALLVERRARGCLAAHAMLAQTAAAAGLGMIVSPMFLYDKTMALPGTYALVPVLGTCLILLFAQERVGTGRLLSARWLVAIGLISYSAYLYHQPIFAFARIVSLERPSTATMLLLIPVVFVLAALSWWLVERPFRKPGVLAWRLAAPGLGSCCACLIALGSVIHFTGGFFSRWKELADQPAEFGTRPNIAYNMRPYDLLNREFDAQSTRAKVLVLGNSFARDFVNMALESGLGKNADLSYSDLADCDSNPFPPRLEANLRSADFIVLGSGVDDKLLACHQRRIRRLSELSDARIIVLGVKNFGWNNNAAMLLPSTERYSLRVEPLPEVLAANALGRSQFSPDTYVDILAAISDPAGRVPVFTPTRKFISQDRRHLTKAGATFVGSLVFRHPTLQLIASPPKPLQGAGR